MALFSISKLVLASLFKRPATIKYPLKPRTYHERTRGQIEIDLDDCIFCGLCQRRCPTHALGVDKAAQSWEIIRLHCIQCNSCVEVCPKHCLHMTNRLPDPAVTERKDRFARVSGDKEDH